jgi:hypothetical protein
MSYPANYKMVTRQGATFRRVFSWSIDDEPVDLSLSTARMEVRRKATSADVILNATEYITLGGDEGTIDLNIPPAVLSAIPPRTGDRSYVYDLEITTGDVVTTLLAGKFIVNPEVTRDDD